MASTEIEYLLAETIVLVTGRIETTTDALFGTPTVTSRVTAVDVALSVQGDSGNGTCVLRLDSKGDDDLSLETSSDKRLQKITYKHVGVGGKVVAAATQLVATVAGVALGRVGPVSPPIGRNDLRAVGLTDEAAAPTVEDLEQIEEALWAQANPTAKRRADALRISLDNAIDKLDSLRNDIISANYDLLVHLSYRERRIEEVIAKLRSELEKLATQRTSWRNSFRSTRQHAIEHAISFDSLPKTPLSHPPVPAKLSEASRLALEELGVVVTTSHRSTAAASAKVDESLTIQWREPERTEITIWRRVGTELVAESTRQVIVVHKGCRVRQIPLGSKGLSGYFGEHGGSLTFDEMGVATRLTMNQTSAAAGLADAVRGVPDALTKGFGDATKLQGQLDEFSQRNQKRSDAEADRDLQNLKRQLETHQVLLAQKSAEATEDDFVKLKVLEQQVAMNAANKNLAGPSEQDVLNNELLRAKTLREIKQVERGATADDDFAAVRYDTESIKAATARLQAEVELLKAKAEKSPT